jgi:nucleotide-binding universal stress UspA family protein
MPAPAYRTILVPLDGSPLSERALPEAVALAERSGARLLLLRVAVADFVTRTDPRSGEPYLVDLAADYLRDVAGRVAAQSAAVAIETVEARGEPGPEIGRVAREREADLIVMATHGRSGLGRWLYGSVADHVLRHAPAPVLLVSALCGPAPARAAGAPGRVLVPLDGSPLAETALAPAAALADAFDARLLLLLVVEPPSPGRAPYGAGYVAAAYDPATALQEARGYLEGVACDLRRRGHRADVAAAEGPAAATIAAAARERRVARIVMATHGRSGLGRMVLGSVATAVLHLADVPLVLVRPEAVRSSAPEVTGGAGRREAR